MKYLFHILIFIAGFLLGSQFSCQRCAPCPETKSSSDTTYDKHSDTTQKYAPEIAVYQGGHIPDVLPGNPKIVYDTMYLEQLQDVDTGVILKDYYAKLFYSDTAITKYGSIYIQDSVTRNRIKHRQVLTDFTIPIVKETVTIKEKSRNEVYFGMNGQLFMPEKSMAIGPSLMFKTKRDKTLRLWATVSNSGHWQYGGGTDFKISLKRRR